MNYRLLGRIAVVVAGVITVSSASTLVSPPLASAVPVTASIDTSSETSVRDAYLNVYVPTQNVQTEWTGSVNGCVAGTTSATTTDAMITEVNYVRAMAGLAPLTQNSTLMTNTQAAALMMQATAANLQANGATQEDAAQQALTHDRTGFTDPADCPSTAGANAAESDNENIHWGSAASVNTPESAVSNWMTDSAAMQWGHRATLLSPNSTIIGTGFTTNFNSTQVDWALTPPSSAFGWPNAGYFPYELIGMTGPTWTFYPQSGDASSDTVTVTKNGDTTNLASNPVPAADSANGNQPSALAWTMPTIAQPAAGAVDTYTVTIKNGASTVDTYAVKIFNAMETSIDQVNVSGTAQVGQTLTASTQGVSPTGATVTYAWSRNGTAIPDATAPTYTATAADLDATLTATATAAMPGFASASATSAATAAVAPGTLTTTTPLISGTAAVDQTLTASADGWGPSGVALTYQWKADGTPIDGATSSTYASTAADLGKTITVSATGSLDGYTSATVDSAATSPVAAGSLTTTTPTIAGTPTVGQTLTASAAGWGPSGVSLTYQWNADATPIAGATSSTYAPTNDDVDKEVTVTVTGSLPGYGDATATSAATDPVLGQLAPATPTVTGTAQVGQPLSADPGVWTPDGEAFSYQWNVDATPIPGATTSTYTPTPGDLGKTITITVTGKRPSYVTDSATSVATDPVIAGVTTAGTPTVDGTPTVGQTLSVDPGDWMPYGTAFAYQWYADGTPIAGATSSTYVLTNAEIGKTITATATGQSTGYTSVSATSAGVGPVAAAVTPAPQQPATNPPASTTQTTQTTQTTTTTQTTQTTSTTPAATASAPSGGTPSASSSSSALAGAVLILGLAGLALLGTRLRRAQR